MNPKAPRGIDFTCWSRIVGLSSVGAHLQPIRRSRLSWFLVGLLALGACATTPPPDYTVFRARMPLSILVLPPLNETNSAEASYSYLSAVTQPLVEHGYYVFPVAVVDNLMKNNGLPTPGEMHQAPLHKLRAYFGADAVLYIVLTGYGSNYYVLGSSVTVAARATLVDARDGTVLWTGEETIHQNNSGANHHSLAATLIAALIGQIVSDASDAAHDLSRVHAQRLVRDKSRGLLRGPRHPEFEGKGIAQVP